jgi:hypothetical protein
MTANRFERGAIVHREDRTWIVWSYPRPLRHAQPVGLPLVHQTQPLHRSHVRFKLAGATVIVQTLDAETVPRDCEQIGQCSDLIVAMIEQTMRRAIEAEQVERREQVA